MDGCSWHCIRGSNQPAPRKRSTKRQNGCLRRPYKKLRKEEKWKAKEKYTHLNAEFQSAGGQCEELRPWQRSWGRMLGIRKGVIKPQETPCSRASTPKPVSVLCFNLHLWLYGGLSPITVSLGEGVNVQLQGNKNYWAWQECFSLWTALKVI